jgi:hypothetical protein
MLVSENVGLAHEGRGDASAVDATAAALRLGLFDCRGDASCVAAEAPAGDERGIGASQRLGALVATSKRTAARSTSISCDGAPLSAHWRGDVDWGGGPLLSCAELW